MRRFFVWCYLRILAVSVLSLSIPLVLSECQAGGFYGFLESCLVCLGWSSLVIFYAGLDKNVRAFITNKVKFFCSKFCG